MATSLGQGWKKRKKEREKMKWKFNFLKFLFRKDVKIVDKKSC